MKEMGLTEDEFYAKQFELKESPEPLKTSWMGPLVVRHVPPRDWPPRGWEVDREELEFIRGAHKLQAVRVDLKKVEESSTDTDDLCLERYKVFLKQYNEWVVANKARLEKESYKVCSDLLFIYLRRIMLCRCLWIYPFTSTSDLWVHLLLDPFGVTELMRMIGQLLP